MSVSELDELSEYEGADILTTEGGDPSHLLADGETVKIDIQGADLADIKDALAAADDREMADGDISAAVDEYLANDGSPEDGVDEFLQWANANLDMDMDALEAAAADYLAESDAESLSETPVSEFMAFLDEDGGGDEPGEPEGEDMGGEMSAKVEELERELSEREETIRELAERVESLEDRPDYGGRTETESDGDESVAADVLTGLGTDGDYITR